MDSLGRLLTVIVIIFIVVWVFNLDTIDSTDKSKSERSGMNLHIDNLTGCHYLSHGWSGNLIKRMDADGNHICTKNESK